MYTIVEEGKNDGTNSQLWVYSADGTTLVGGPIGCASRSGTTATGVSFAFGVGGSETETSGSKLWYRNALFGATQPPL